MKRIIAIVLCAFLALSLSGCITYSEEDVRRIRSDAYDSGFEDGEIFGRNSRLEEAYRLAQNLEDQISQAMVMIEEYPEYDLEQVFSALEDARAACRELQSELDG